MTRKKIAIVLGIIYACALMGGGMALWTGGGNFGQFPEGIIYGGGVGVAGLGLCFLPYALSTNLLAVDGLLTFLQLAFTILAALAAIF